jgi:hypothetical protein
MPAASAARRPPQVYSGGKHGELWPLVAKLTSERDSALRAAVLGALEVLYAFEGDGGRCAALRPPPRPAAASCARLGPAPGGRPAQADARPAPSIRGALGEGLWSRSCRPAAALQARWPCWGG